MQGYKIVWVVLVVTPCLSYWISIYYPSTRWTEKTLFCPSWTKTAIKLWQKLSNIPQFYCEAAPCISIYINSGVISGNMALWVSGRCLDLWLIVIGATRGASIQSKTIVKPKSKSKTKEPIEGKRQGNCTSAHTIHNIPDSRPPLQPPPTNNFSQAIDSKSSCFKCLSISMMM